MRVQDLELPLFGTILGGAIYMGPFWEGKPIGSDPQEKKKKDLKGELRIWRIKMQARVQGSVLLKDSIRFK